jgi:hypothetical protein
LKQENGTWEADGKHQMSRNQKHEKGVMTNDDEIARRKGLTFAQAEGAEALPTQLKRTEVSKSFGITSMTGSRKRQTRTWTYIGFPGGPF